METNCKNIRIEVDATLYDILKQKQKVEKIANGRKTPLAEIFCQYAQLGIQAEGTLSLSRKDRSQFDQNENDQNLASNEKEVSIPPYLNKIEELTQKIDVLSDEEAKELPEFEKGKQYLHKWKQDQEKAIEKSPPKPSNELDQFPWNIADLVKATGDKKRKDEKALQPLSDEQETAPLGASKPVGKQPPKVVSQSVSKPPTVSSGLNHTIPKVIEKGKLEALKAQLINIKAYSNLHLAFLEEKRKHESKLAQERALMAESELIRTQKGRLKYILTKEQIHWRELADRLCLNEEFVYQELMDETPGLHEELIGALIKRYGHKFGADWIRFGYRIWAVSA